MADTGSEEGSFYDAKDNPSFASNISKHSHQSSNSPNQSLVNARAHDIAPGKSAADIRMYAFFAIVKWLSFSIGSLFVALQSHTQFWDFEPYNSFDLLFRAYEHPWSFAKHAKWFSSFCIGNKLALRWRRTTTCHTYNRCTIYRKQLFRCTTLTIEWHSHWPLSPTTSVGW